MRVKELFKFIKERHLIYIRRLTMPKPWTADPILQSYRFCNVYRELDTVTQWIAKNWRDKHWGDRDLWFAMVVARKVNWPNSLAAVGYPVPWHASSFKRTMESRAAAGQQLEGGAYMITAGVGAKWKGVPKYRFLADAVFTPMWENREAIRPRTGDTLAFFHSRLESAGMTVGSFIAGQVVADLKFAKNSPLAAASDWWDWAAMGPGSARGLSRVLGYEVDRKWKQPEWLARLHELQAAIAPLVKKEAMPRIHNQDLQNCLCEWDKYERVRLGQGKPRSCYDGT